MASGLVTSPPLTPEDAGPQAAITADTAAVFGNAAAMSKTPASSAQGIPNPFTSLWNGAEQVLRTMSYYEMKNRAGVIGRNGLGPMIGQLAVANAGIRVHMMGHSFGNRLVSYALSGREVRYLGGFFLIGTGPAICIFQAESASDVAAVNKQAGVPATDIAEAIDLRAAP